MRGHAKFNLWPPMARYGFLITVQCLKSQAKFNLRQMAVSLGLSGRFFALRWSRKIQSPPKAAKYGLLSRISVIEKLYKIYSLANDGQIQPVWSNFANRRAT